MSYNRLSEMDTKRHHNQDWNTSSHWASEGPSMLSSTRMSAVGPASAIPTLKEEGLFTDDGLFTSKANVHTAITDGRISPSRRDTLPSFPSRRASRKSVSFRDVDEYFPVFSPEYPKQQPTVGTSTLPFELSEYSDFLDSERMATVLPKQGIDVTSPDHVFVFGRESSESTDEDMEKTVISYSALAESDDEKEGESVKEALGNIPEQSARSCGGSSSSGTGSSHYSSCESDHYTSALDASIHPRHLSLPMVEEVSVGVESDKKTTQTEPQIHSKLESVEHLPGMLDKVVLSEGKHPMNDVFKADTPLDDAAEATQGDINCPFTPSPFVTGRTRSRLSRCSLRTSRMLESLASSSLFEETLPTPVRSQRHTPRSQRRDALYSSPHAPCYTPSYSGSSTGRDFLPADCQDTQSSTLRASSSVSNSQADTLILSRSVTESAVESQTLGDTVILEKNQDSSVNAYERNLAEIILAVQKQGTYLAEGKDFLTDDLTSTDEATTRGNISDGPDVDPLKNEDVCITDDCSSQLDSVSSSSSSSYFSPRRSREDSDLPCTPGTGCTPRYSMSRLSSYRRPQHLANLSYTPGGRPLIQDVDEPVEYLYTDTEQGHKLIETHVPPTANTSLSSSMSTTSNEETILYDWRSMQTDMKQNTGKENQKPQETLQNEKRDEGKDRLLLETKGMTDKELRLRLVELGENPGPINSRTRPTYMRKLCRLLQESNSQSPHPQKQLHQSKTGTDYVPNECF